MTIWVVRHGRTEANAAGRLLGRADPELDPVGLRQARQVAGALPAGARVISSPLRRCAATAELIEPGAEHDDRLLELDYGQLDLTPLSEVPAGLWRRWRADPGFRPPGGESLDELALRVSALLDEIAPSAVGAQVVLVTHVSPIKAALAWALGAGIEVSWRSFVAPASITRVEITGSGPSLHAFNLTGHLDELPGRPGSDREDP
jgi:broad specificity phosphatase PhoE